MDYRDHRDFSLPLEYLLLSDAEYTEAALAEDFGFGCQLRASDHRRMFENAGFRFFEFRPSSEASEEYLDDFLPRLRASKSAFRERSREELKVTGGLLLMQKN